MDYTDEAPTVYLHLRSTRWDIPGIRLCVDRYACAGGEPRRAAGTTPAIMRLSPEAPRHLVTVCTTILFNADRLSPTSEISLLEQWLQYHELIGIDHFMVYDSDGSASATVGERVKRGSVSYFPRWPSQLSSKMAALSRSKDCTKCLSAQAEAHCLWASRGVSKWVLSLHSFDAYLALGQGLQYPIDMTSVLESFEAQRTRIGTVAVPMLDFGGPPHNTSWLLGRFRQRWPQPISIVAESQRGNPRAESWLNTMGSTLRNPNEVVGVLDHWSRSRPGAVDIEAPHQLMRVNHYVDLFGPRCASHFLHCDTYDDGLMWALPVLCVRAGLPACCAEAHCQT